MPIHFHFLDSFTFFKKNDQKRCAIFTSHSSFVTRTHARTHPVTLTTFIIYLCQKTTTRGFA